MSNPGDALEQSGRLGKRGLDLGWIAGGTVVQPSKRKAIEGVSAASIMDLQAQLYQAQEAARLAKEGGVDVGEKHARRRAGVDVKGLLGPSNPGVQARDQQDKLHIKTASDRTSECYAALERKAELYERLRRGDVDDDDEQYEVDFLAKGGWRSGAAEAEPRSQARSGGILGQDDGSDKEAEGRPRQREGQDGLHILEEEEENAKRRQRTEAILELAKETKVSRERALQSKRVREEQAKSKVDKLKEDLLRRVASRLKQGRSASGQGTKDGGTATAG